MEKDVTFKGTNLWILIFAILITYCILHSKKIIDTNQLKVIRNWLKVRVAADALEVLIR